MRRWSLLALVGFFACLQPAAHADFDSAVAAYQKRDFAAAEIEFRRLAELGDAPSQRNLAAMYARGEHLAQDLVMAWAWVALAAETDSEAATLRDRLGKRLGAEEAATAERERVKLGANFGVEAIRTRLMPIPAEREADSTVDVTSEAKPLRRIAPNYPSKALRDGIEGHACMMLYLARDGSVLRASAHSAVAHPKGRTSSDAHAQYAQAFSEASLTSARKASFVPPATERLREVPGKYCVAFRVADDDDDGQQIPEIKMKREAVEGKLESQYKLAVLAELRSTDTNLSRRQRKRSAHAAQGLYLQSAIAGYAPSQFSVARRLLTGNQCEKDVAKGLAWLQLAAQQGDTESQYLLGSRLLHGEDVKSDPDKALNWLQAAVNAGHAHARVELARYWLLHAPERRAEALALLPSQPEPHDIAQLEGAALAAAFRGDFGQAAIHQREVVAIAADLDFAIEDRRRRLTAFQAQRLPEELAASPPS